MAKLIQPRLTRRSMLIGSAAATATLAMPSISRAQARPVFTHGVQSGDVTANSGMIWTRTDRPAKVFMEVSTTEGFGNARQLAPLYSGPSADMTVKRMVSDLPADQDIFYRFTAHDVADVNAVSEPIVGHFRTAPTSRRSVRFAWSGDTVGQGYGIDEQGMRTYATINQHDPDFFLHSGDTIYADGALSDEMQAGDGTTWANVIVTPEKSKVAETLDEYRGQWKYNMMDEHVLALSAQVPTFYQWDDHEVINNWSASKDLTADDRYSEKSIWTLAQRSARAFHEMTPISYVAEEPGRIYRKINYGPMLDIFFLDMRSYRGPNGADLENEINADSQFLGREQINWLKRELANSTATWKVIAADMPIGLVVPDGDKIEAIAQGDNGVPKGRELEVADLLGFIRDAGVKNTVWLTADVHYTAAHHYSPERARFQDFEPFWEFVSGPLHAGTFGPNKLDGTFGPEEVFVKAPGEGQVNLPPSAGLQFFGLVDIDGATQQMKVRLMDVGNTELWSVTLDPEGQTF